MTRVPKTVLFVDSDGDLLRAFVCRAQEIGLQAIAAQNPMTALSLIKRYRPDAICLDIGMPTGGGLDFGRLLIETEDVSSVMLVAITGQDDAETLATCRELGLEHVRKGDGVWSRLEPLLRTLQTDNAGDDNTVATSESEASACELEAADKEPSHDELTEMVFSLLGAGDALFENLDDPAAEHNDSPWILCIEDDEDFSFALKVKLEKEGFQVVRAFEGVEGVQCAYHRPAEAILLDYNLPNGQGDYVLRRLKANPLTNSIPVIVITGLKDPWVEKQMMHLGAARVFTKPMSFVDLMAELRTQNVTATVGER